jgi:beta-glucosidase
MGRRTVCWSSMPLPLISPPLNPPTYVLTRTFQVGAIPRLGLRSLCMQDAPVGVRFGDYVSVFSSGQTVAATFDRGLMYARGYAIGSEHKAKGVSVVLGPVAGPLGRHPEGGRNWEGFSPDPYLSMFPRCT